MDPEAFFGMMIGFGLVVVLPITAILTSHQRKMAELMARRAPNEQNNGERERIAQLEAEVYELKQTLQSHIIATDQIMAGQDFRQLSGTDQRLEQKPTPPLPEEIRTKLG